MKPDRPSQFLMDVLATSPNFSRSLRFVIVLLSCVLAFCIRLFSNLMSEPIIHEFDPHFNWRCTRYIDSHGLYEFLGWFDKSRGIHRAVQSARLPIRV
jgi:hypothetical protein